MIERSSIASSATIYDPALVNVYGCTILDGVTVAPFVEIQGGVIIGAGSKISTHSFICRNTFLGKSVFVGHGVMFANDIYPVIGGDNRLRSAVVGDGASIGSGAVILPVVIGEGAIIGAGSVVTEDVPPWSIVAGNPAKVLRVFEDKTARDAYITRKLDQRENGYK